MTQQITLIKDKILSDNYFTLHNITYDLTRKDGEVIRHKREVYDRGNGAFIAEYSDNQRANAGGGVEDEDIEVLELPFSQALEMIKTGEIRDGKTVLLLNYLQTSHLMD
ncbi:TPA: hypothetical protein ACSBI8_000197 [Shigella sonnei]|nr:hypothetical protein [Shigella sonnei]